MIQPWPQLENLLQNGVGSFYWKQCFHVNFSTYLNEYRIEKARALMQNPRINIKDISIACGYSDPNYFTRVFKRLTGLTPTEYRLSCLNPE